MCAKTSVIASPSLKENKFWLNGVEQTFDNERLQNCLTERKFTLKSRYMTEINEKFKCSSKTQSKYRLATFKLEYRNLLRK